MAKVKFALGGKKYASREAFNKALEEGAKPKSVRKPAATPRVKAAKATVPRARKTKAPAVVTACGLLSRGLRTGCGKNANNVVSDAKVRAVQLFAKKIVDLPTEQMPAVLQAMEPAQPQAAPVGMVEDVGMRAAPPKTGAQVSAPGESRVTALATAASVDPPVQPNPAPVRKRAVLTAVTGPVTQLGEFAAGGRMSGGGLSAVERDPSLMARVAQLESGKQYSLKASDVKSVPKKDRLKNAMELTRLTYKGGGQFKGDFLDRLAAKYAGR
jgi:hypothetical protein